MTKLLTYEVRAELLSRLLPLAQQYDNMAAETELWEEGEEEQHQEFFDKLYAMNEEIFNLLERYLEGLPVRGLSRCPFTGEKVFMAIDDMGLDGLWWNADAPKRPESELPKTFFALDGALVLSGEVEKAPFNCRPGPDVPYVLPRLLEFHQVKAVISSIRIGNHMGFPIFYYADPMLEGELRVNEWGTNKYWEETAVLPELSSPGRFINVVPDSNEFDFDLEPWIRSGKLMWIAPGDESLMLRSNIANCPYLDLPGSRKLKYIYDGVVYEEDKEIAYMAEDDPRIDMERFQEILKILEEGQVENEQE